MIYCRGCGKEIHETAVACPQCGALQSGSATYPAPNAQGTLWLPVPAIICGIIALLGLLDESAWDEDRYIGTFLLIFIAIILGIAGAATQEKGRGMSIAGIVLGIIGLLGVLGTLAD